MKYPFTKEFPDGMSIRAYFITEWDFEADKPLGLRGAIKGLLEEIHGMGHAQVQRELDEYDIKMRARFNRAMNIARLAGMLKEGY